MIHFYLTNKCYIFIHSEIFWNIYFSRL